VIDLHSHILPGVDDGPATLEESLELARSAAADGIRVIAATPHVRSDYPTTPQAMTKALAELRDAAGDVIELVPGGELDLAELDRPVEELRAFALAGNSQYLLVETPYYGWPLDLADRLLSLQAAGITPVLAHPERNAEVQAHPDRLVQLVEGGVLVQVTCASLDGRIGRRPQECARRLIDAGIVHLLASDAHHASVREVGMRAAAKAVGGKLAEWLTYEVPAAIVDDTPIPPRPHRSGRSRSGWLGKLFTA